MVLKVRLVTFVVRNVSLNLTNLISGSRALRFTYQDVHSCSCSGSPDTCQSCLSSLSEDLSADYIPPTTPQSTKLNTSSDSRHGRRVIKEPLRLPYNLLMNALRLRMIDDICRMSVNTRFPDAHRLQNGFVFDDNAAEADWSNGWENSEISR